MQSACKYVCLEDGVGEKEGVGAASLNIRIENTSYMVPYLFSYKLEFF